MTRQREDELAAMGIDPATQDGTATPGWQAVQRALAARSARQN